MFIYVRFTFNPPVGLLRNLSPMLSDIVFSELLFGGGGSGTELVLKGKSVGSGGKVSRADASPREARDSQLD